MLKIYDSYKIYCSKIRLVYNKEELCDNFEYCDSCKYYKLELCKFLVYCLE